MPLLSDASAVMLGDVPVKKVYLGETQVWSAEPPPWTPADLPQLDVWIDETCLPSGEGSPILSLIERSRYHRIFTAPEGKVPWREGNSIRLNGAQTLRCPDYHPGPDGITMVSVNSWTIDIAYAMIWQWRDDIALGFETRYGNPGCIQLVGNYSMGGPAWVSTYYQEPSVTYLNWAEFKTNTHARLWVNSIDCGGVHMIAIPEGVSSLSLGSRPDGFYLNGTISEALLFSGVLSTTDRQQVEQYLMTKHGLSAG